MICFFFEFFEANAETSGQEQDELNFLMQMALQKLAFVPFGYLIDKWRWDVYSGEIKLEELNSQWWKLRGKFHRSLTFKNDVNK